MSVPDSAGTFASDDHWQNRADIAKLVYDQNLQFALPTLSMLAFSEACSHFVFVSTSASVELEPGKETHRVRLTLHSPIVWLGT